jgi:transposase
VKSSSILPGSQGRLDQHQKTLLFPQHNLIRRGMRGKDEQQLDVFSYVSAEQRIPQDHPLRPLRAMADEALHQLQSRFRRLYAKNGRPSIAPEKLLRALLLQVLYSVRSERMLMEQLDYNLLFRWFVGLNMDDGIWDATVFTKNRQRLLAGDIADAFFAAVLRQARQRNLLSDEHFTVDGTLLEAWAGQKSFRRVDDDHQPPAAVAAEYSNPTVNFHGEKRSNQTHCSTTDPDAMLARKSRGTGAVLAYRGHLLTENRNGLVVSTLTTRAYGSAERDAALLMAEALPGTSRVTLGADKGYDVHDFVAELRHMDITPHVAQNDTSRRSAIDERTTRHAGYQLSQRKRKRIEEVFGWMKSIGLLRKIRHRGLDRVGWMFTFTAAAYNLIRMRNLMLKCA